MADIATDAGRSALVDAMQGLKFGLLVPAAGFGTGGACLDSQPRELHEMVTLNCACVSELVCSSRRR